MKWSLIASYVGSRKLTLYMANPLRSLTMNLFSQQQSIFV